MWFCGSTSLVNSQALVAALVHQARLLSAIRLHFLPGKSLPPLSPPTTAGGALEDFFWGREEPPEQGISEHPLPAQRGRNCLQVIACSRSRDGRLIYLWAARLVVWGFLFCGRGGEIASW